MPTLTLKISENLLKKLTEHAAAKEESVETFSMHALQDALNMWEDFYELDDQFEQEFEEARPDATFFLQA